MIILLFVSGLAASMFFVLPSPQDDHFYYQAFVERLAGGHFDLSIPGFHGADILAVPFFWLNHSPVAQIEFQMFCVLLLPLLGFLAGRRLFGSAWHGVMLSAAVTMMPFSSFVMLRGWTGPSYLCLLLLTLFAIAGKKWWSWIPWAFAILTKPFAVALLPLFFVFPRSKSSWRMLSIVALGLFFPTLYVVAQYLQVGHVLVGVHTTITEKTVWQGPLRILLNWAHTFQILFSVHNYYFPNPALTGPGNMMHTTPVLIFLGIFALLEPKKYFPNIRFPAALACGILVAIGLNTLLDHMDHIYMETGILLLIVASLPALRKHPCWIPFALFTLHFQWFYFFLQFRTPFHITLPFLMIVPAIVDGIFLLWVLALIPNMLKSFSRFLDGNPLKRWIFGSTRSTRIQFFRYFFVGGSSAVVDFCVYVTLLHFGIHYLLAQFVAYCIGFVWNYLFSILWVFQTSKQFAREIIATFIITMFGLLWTELLLFGMVDFFGVGEIVAKIIATAIVLFWNFGARKVFVFRK